ncbi:OpgC family protein [Aureimonas mangrovi]|uniref:OpgC family protein n=1 Tax=Aureimonas mangrovi TaxID=2758041 RepID=UPI00163D809F|nr:OpgC domain-containing protein [Aureimonas mangrovi]
MKRLDVLDGMRGYFLVFMMLNHLSFAGGYLLVKINHGELGYVQDAQGFVFLSGLLIGMVYAGHMAKRGYEAGSVKVRKRALELYRWAMFCVLAIIALGFVLPRSGVFWEPWLWRLGDDPALLFGAAATLLYQPTYMDILPQYIVYLLVSPPLIWLCVTGRWRMVALGSALLWMAVQFGLHLPLRDAIHAGMQALHPDLALRAHFNVLAWQAIFMSGLVIGALTATKEIDWDEAMSPKRPEFAVAALAIVLFFMAWRVAFTWGLVPEIMAQRFGTLDIRGEFSLVYLLNFAALGYLVAWTLIAGPRSESAVVRKIAAVPRAIFTLPFLRLIGRHSLQVYVWHVIAIYVLKAVDYHHGPFSETNKTLIALAAIASLAVPALWREWRASVAKKDTVGAKAA